MFDDRVYKRGALTLHVLRRHHRRRRLLCAAARLDHPPSPRHRRHRRLHRPGGQLLERVTAAAVAGLAVLDGRPRPVTDGASTVPAQGPATRGSFARVGAATVLSALCGYAVLYLAARDLEPAGFSVFAVFWGAFGLLAGSANGLLQESTREVRQAQQGRRSTSRGGVGEGPRIHPMRVAVLVGVVAAVVVVGTVAAVVGPRLRRGAAAQRRTAQRGDRRVLHARDAARRAGRREPLERVRLADRRRRRDAGGRRDGHVPGRLGTGRLPVGHRGGVDRLARAAAGVADRRGPRRVCSPPAPR